MGQPDPASFEQAGQTMVALERLAPGPNPRFIALGEQMAARYPILGRESAFERNDGDGDTNDAVWIGDPLADAKSCTSAVWAFELPREDTVHALRFVVERANALGLTVFDEQLGIAFVPPDRVLPPSRAALWEGAKRDMDNAPERWTLATARKAIKPRFTALMQAHGFEPEKPPPESQGAMQYRRTTESGFQVVYMYSRSIHGVPEFGVHLQAKSNAITEVLRAALPERPIVSGEEYASGQLAFDIRRFVDFHVGSGGGGIPLKSAAEVDRILGAMEEPILRILDMARTDAGMERVLNDGTLFPMRAPHRLDPKSLAEYSRGHGYATLISAWRYNNDQFEEIAEFVRQHSKTLTPELRHHDRVLDYLRQHVKRGM